MEFSKPLNVGARKHSRASTQRDFSSEVEANKKGNKSKDTSVTLNRLMEFKRRQEQSREKEERMQEEREREMCTFQPNIKPSALYRGKEGSREKRSFNEFYEQ